MPKIENVDKILEEQRALFFSKLADYGTEDITEIGIEGVVNRLTEKLCRVKNLLKKGGGASVESIRDSYMDIMGYALIALLVHDGDWEKGIDESAILIQRSQAAKEFDIPTPKKAGDVGFDLYTLEDTLIPSNVELPIDVPTGVKVKLPKNTWALIINRSSTPRKKGIEVVPGIIDTGYTGELYACCFNRTGEDILVKAGTRLAQFLILPSVVPQIKEVDKLPKTERGETGFGSTD